MGDPEMPPTPQERPEEQQEEGLEFDPSAQLKELGEQIEEQPEE